MSTTTTKSIFGIFKETRDDVKLSYFRMPEFWWKNEDSMLVPISMKDFNEGVKLLTTWSWSLQTESFFTLWHFQRKHILLLSNKIYLRTEPLI